MKYYAGIGSRDCPEDVWDLMVKIGQYMAQQGYVLRSGAAKAKDGEWSADEAFEWGCDMVRGKKEIFKPHHATQEAIKLAMEIHPAPQNCTSYVKQLHGRNSQIILGLQLDSPVEVVYCYTSNGKAIGGTGLGIKLANVNNIVVKNLYYQEVRKEIEDMFNDN